MSPLAQPRYTAEEYLAMERASRVRHEYLGGSIYAMTGASRAHNLIALNLGGELRAQLRGRPCETYVEGMRVKVSATGLYTYPDVTVVCGEPLFEDEQVDTLTNPTLIIEVLSESTEAYDRGKKWNQYRRLGSLREYVLVAQDRVSVERYLRQGEMWLFSETNDLSGTLSLESIGCTLAMRDVYERVEFPSPGPERPS